MSGTHMLAHRARIGFIRLNAAASYLIVIPSRPYSSRRAPGVVAAAAAPAAAAAASVAPVQLQAPLPELSFAERAGVWDADHKLQLKNLTLDELSEWCESMGASLGCLCATQFCSKLLLLRLLASCYGSAAAYGLCFTLPDCSSFTLDTHALQPSFALPVTF